MSRTGSPFKPDVLTAFSRIFVEEVLRSYRRRAQRMAEQLGIAFDVESTRDPKTLSLLLKSLADHPSAQVLNSLLLRSMKQATYDVANVGHFGLASKAYLHFTSPIRRYPDLVVHRSVHALALGRRIEKDGAAITLLAEAALAASI